LLGNKNFDEKLFLKFFEIFLGFIPLLYLILKLRVQHVRMVGSSIRVFQDDPACVWRC